MARNMSNLVARLLNNSFKTILQHNVCTVNYATFAYRDFVIDNFHGGSGTLIHHYMKYIALENVKRAPVINREVKYSQFYPLHNVGAFKSVLKNVSSEQLPKLLVFTYTYKTNADVNKFVEVINELDKECTRRLESLSFDNTLRLMYAFMYLIPNRITQTTFYQEGIPKLLNEFNENKSKSNFVEVCFYLGLAKRNRNYVDYIKEFLSSYFNEFLQELNSTDFGIICNSAFKTSSRISSDLYQERIEREIVDMTEINIPLLVTLIKSVRHNRVKSNNIQETMKNLLFSGALSEIDFRGLVHFFAYFADNLVQDDKIAKYFVETGLSKFEEETVLRPKDLATFLWSCSHLGLDLLEKNDIKLIANTIIQKCQNLEYKYCPDELVDSILSLWMMGYKIPSLVPMIFENRNLFKQQDPDRIRLDSRLKLLFSCVEIEAPRIVKDIPEAPKSRGFDEDNKAPDYLIKHRRRLQIVGNILNDLKEEFEIKNVKFVSQIKHLNIAGIVIEFEDDTKSTLHFEVFDPSNTLIDHVTPMGIFKLKLRLLKQVGCNIIEIESTNGDDLKEMVRRELKTFCDDQSKLEIRNKIA